MTIVREPDFYYIFIISHEECKVFATYESHIYVLAVQVNLCTFANRARADGIRAGWVIVHYINTKHTAEGRYILLQMEARSSASPWPSMLRVPTVLISATRAGSADNYSPTLVSNSLTFPCREISAMGRGLRGILRGVMHRLVMRVSSNTHDGDTRVVHNAEWVTLNFVQPAW